MTGIKERGHISRDLALLFLKQGPERQSYNIPGEA